MFNPFRRPPPGTPATSEETWLRRIAESQDRAALAALYREYQPRLVRFLGRVTRHEALIEEVVNDTCGSSGSAPPITAVMPASRPGSWASPTAWR